jgi:hypothetical protein
MRTEGSKGSNEKMPRQRSIGFKRLHWARSLFSVLRAVQNGLLSVFLSASMCGAGCGSRPASVEGDVTYDGQPIGVGRILFEPEDPKAIKRGGRFENGHYKLAPPEGPPPGKHRVVINWLKPTGKTYRNEFNEELPQLSEGLPDKYHKDSTLTATIKPGKNVVDFRLEK